VTNQTEVVLGEALAALLPHLDERQRRLALGAAARVLGMGVCAGWRGLRGWRSRRWRGARELGGEPADRVRAVGAGTVAALPRGRGVLPAGHLTDYQGRPPPGPRRAVRYLNGQVKEFTAAGQPVVSVDAKQQEVLGQDAAAGQDWQRAGSRYGCAPTTSPTRAPTRRALRHRRPGRRRRGGVSGLGRGTPPVFAVATLGRWWNGEGRHRDPPATRRLICMDHATRAVLAQRQVSGAPGEVPAFAAAVRPGSGRCGGHRRCAAHPPRCRRVPGTPAAVGSGRSRLVQLPAWRPAQALAGRLRLTDTIQSTSVI
jgi:Rhodopirellula transposase DDE domain